MASGIPISGKEKNQILNRLEEQAAEYIEYNKAINTANKAKEEIKKSVSGYVKEFGELNTEGHTVLDFDEFEIVLQKRKINTFNEQNAKEILERRGVFDRATTVVIDKAKIEALYQDGDLTAKDIEGMYDSEETEAFYVNVKE